MRGGALAVLLTLLVAGAAGAEEGAAAPLVVGEAPLLSAGPFQYFPGRGLRFGETGFTVGGFTNVKAEETPADGAEFALDLLNFFLIYDGIPRFRAVAELQLRDVVVVDRDAAGAQDFAFDVRRLFGDYTIADAQRLRLGTFLTPVGYWNLILAPPLTWTTEAPLIVEDAFFQQTTTGAMAHGSVGAGPGRLHYELFSQFLHPIEDDPELDPPDLTAGLRLAYGAGTTWSIGPSYQAAETHGAWSHLAGLYGLWQPRRGQILGEFLWQDGGDLASPQWGTYLQGVLEVYGPFFAVGRYEHYDQPTPDPTLDLFTVGAVYKPFPFMALKVEYRFVVAAPPEDNPEGFFASFTSFF